MVAFIQALINLLAALAGSIQRYPDNSQIDQCVPVAADLTSLYDANRAQLEQHIAGYLAAVRARWARAEAQGLIQYLQNSESMQAQMASQDVKWIDGLRGKRFSKYYDRLWFGQLPVTLAIDLVQQAEATALQNITVDKPTLLESVYQLRRLDDLLIRILAAKTAADLTGCTLAEVLTLYRTEGNLGVPRDAESIDQLIPPREPDHYEGTKLNYYDLPNSPNFSSLVYVWGSNQLGTEDIAINAAITDWMIHIAGLDIINQVNFGEWSARNWSAQTGTPVTPDSRRAMIDELRTKMRVEAVYRDAAGNLQVINGIPVPYDGFVRVLPTDTEFLISRILAEAVLFLRFGGRPRYLNGTVDDPPGFPADWIAPPRLTYALYNLQVGTPNKSPKEAFVMSALIYASSTTGAKYQALRSEISADAGFKERLQKDIGPDVRHAAFITQEMVDAYFPEIQSWLFDAAKGKRRVELLSNFIETADRKVWISWDKSGINSYRGNANRYHLLYVYYHLLTGVEPPF